MLKQKKPKKKKPKKRRVFASMPIARYAGDIKTSRIWDRMGYATTP